MGRPCLYKPEYCELLIIHMSSGLSFESFAGEVGVGRRTIFDWLKRFPEFKEAKDVATMKSLLWWEKFGMKGLDGKVRGFNAAIWIFAMKHRFKWRDDHYRNAKEGKDPPPGAPPVQMDQETLLKLVKRVREGK